MTPRVSIIIVNWNGRRYIESCLDSIEQTIPSQHREIIVVDNASEDGSVEFARSKYPGVTVISNVGNRGFAGGVNDGARVARGRFLLVLNPDIALRPNTVETLIEFLERHDECGAAMPRLLNLDGSDQNGYARCLPSFGQVLFFYTSLEPWSNRHPSLVRRYLEAPFAHESEFVEVEQIPGAFLLTTKKLFGEVGEWNERYQLFFEDVDWSFRVRAMGKKLIMHSGVTASHIGGSSFKMNDKTWLWGRFLVSLMLFFDDHKSVLESVCVKTILVLNSIVIILWKSLLLFLLRADPTGSRRISVQTHQYVLRLFCQTFILKDVPPLNPPNN